MSSEQIVIWLDTPKYNALQRILSECGTDIEAVMQARLEAYYQETVPSQERTRINLDIEAERLAQERNAEEARQFSVFRVKEGGAETIFESTLHLSEAQAAARLRRFIQGERTGPAGVYADLTGQVRNINQEVFDRRAGEFCAGSEKIHSVLSVDMDAGSFAFLDRAQGWKRYAVRDVSTAAYHAYRMTGRPEDWARQIFREKLEGKELPRRQLMERDVSFSDEILETDGRLSFYMNTDFPVDEVFGTSVNAGENDDWLNVYANLDLQERRVCDELQLVLHQASGKNTELSYPLNAEEKEMLLAKMDAYCLEQEGLTLEQLCAQTQSGEQPGMAPMG